MNGQMPMCPVCRLHPESGLAFCGFCGKAYDRAGLDLTHAALIRWVAVRAWRFASRKHAAERDTLRARVAELTAERDVLRARVRELEAPPVVPEGYEVELDESETSSGEPFWSWSFTETVTSDGEYCNSDMPPEYRKNLARLYRAFAWAIEHDQRPPHAGDKP